MNSIYVGIRFILGVFSVKIISVYLGPSGMAITSHFRDFIKMFKTISSLGINNSVITTVKKNDLSKDELSQTLSSFFWFYVLLSSFLGGFIALFARAINELLFENQEYYEVITIAGLLLPLYFMYLFMRAVLNSLEHFKQIIIAEIISAITVFLITVVLVIEYGVKGGLYAIVVVDVMAFLLMLYFYLKYAKKLGLSLNTILKKSHLRILKNFGVIALISAFLVPLTLIVIRSNIINRLGEIHAGNWDAVKRISNFYLMFITSGLTLYYIPRIASIQNDHLLKREVKKYYFYFMPIVIVGFLLIYILRDVVVQIVLTKEFYQVKELMVWQFIGDTIKIATLAFGYILSVRAMVLKYFIIEIVFNLSFYLLSEFLLISNGVEGVVIGYAIANFLSCLVILIFFKDLIFQKTINAAK